MKALKNKMFVMTMSVIFSILLLVLSMYLHSSKKQMQAQKGILDLTNWDFSKDGVVSLDGEWEFYWNELLTYEDFNERRVVKPNGYFQVPDVWTSYTVDDKHFPQQGYATYRLTVKTNNIDDLKGLKILTASTSYKLMVNDKVVARSGTVGKTEETSEPEFKPQAVSFKNDSKSFDIIVQISNYTYSRGGMWHSIYLGDDQQVREMKEFNSEKDMFMLGTVIIMSLYHMLLFILQKRSKSVFYFALILLIVAIRITITGEYLIHNIISMPSIMWMVPIEYMTMYWGVIVGLAFIYELYPKETSKRLVKFSTYVGIIVSIFTIAMPIGIFTDYLVIYELLSILVFCYISFSVTKAAIKKEEGAILLLLGAIIMLIAYINDILYHWNVISDRYGPSVGIAIFIVIFMQAYILAVKFSLAFKKVENLSERLILLDRLKDEFLINTSHELRTPLNGIINITQSLINGIAGKLNFNQEEDLSIVLASSRRLYNLINDISDISNLKYNQLKLYPKPLDINTVAETVIFILNFLKGEKDIVFENLIPTDTPLVFCDEERLDQVFFNILENSLKFTEKGSIKIYANCSENMVTIFIEDTGSGIDESKIGNIFDTFGQTPGTSEETKNENSGLGLSITKRLIELQGGTIGVKSQLGRGSCFFFTLPLAKEEHKTIGVGKIESPMILNKKSRDEEKLGEYNILVIEDDVVNLKALVNNLRLYNYTVQGASSGEDALRFIDNGINFDVIILDTIMPGTPGYNILKKIREKYSPVELPVLILTVARRIDHISTWFKLGANDYLIKPFESEELKARVYSLINMKKAVNSLVATELSFLQAQIKPHFIYNVLSVISSLTLVQPAKAKELVLDLSDYLRKSFDFESKDGLTTLKKELSLVKSYIAIEQARFKERLCVEFEINDIDIDYVIPILCIQPIVENAVRHGIIPVIDGGRILIVVKNEKEHIKISVSDNGVGIDEKILEDIFSEETGSGSVGIKNIHRRLTNLYGKGLTIRRREIGGTEVEFEIPCRDYRRKKA